MTDEKPSSHKRTCLAPFFLGNPELGFAENKFDVVLSRSLVSHNRRSLDNVVAVNLAIARFVSETIAGGGQPIVFCGDCLSALGCLAGFSSRGCNLDYLLWFDAHGDFHTTETTISGHMGGMPLAMLTGRGNQEIMLRLALPPLPDMRVVHVGARDIEQGEGELIRASGIQMRNSVNEVIGSIPAGAKVWIHFDTDYINPADAPAMRYPAFGGPRASDVQMELASVGEQFKVLGVSISGWAPHLDDGLGTDGHTAEVCWRTMSPIVPFWPTSRPSPWLRTL